MQVDIPEGRALVRYINGETARVIYRDGKGAFVSKVVAVPSRLRPALARLGDVKLVHGRYHSEVEVPVLIAAHTVRLAWAGGIETLLHGGDRPYQIRIERMVI